MIRNLHGNPSKGGEREKEPGKRKKRKNEQTGSAKGARGEKQKVPLKSLEREKKTTYQDS